jgi:hypothetical protein
MAQSSPLESSSILRLVEPVYTGENNKLTTRGCRYHLHSWLQIAVTPVLEKLSLYLSSESNKLRQTLGRNHEQAHEPEDLIYGFSSTKSLVELVCCIVGTTTSLDQLILDTQGLLFRSLSPLSPNSLTN